MRVVHIVDNWLPLTQNWLASSIRHLPPSINSTVVSRSLSADAPPLPGAFVQVPPLAGGLVGRVLDVVAPGLEPDRLARRMAGLDPDVMHAHFGTAGWDARSAGRLLDRPFVVSFYGLDVDMLPRSSRRWRRRYAHIFKDAALVLALGPWMSNKLMVHGADPAQIAVHHLGVPVSDVAFRSRSWDGSRPLRVLIASSFREKKGIPVALEALASLRRRVPITVTLVGDASAYRPEQREKARILETIARTGLGDVVRRLGFVSHAELLRLAQEHDLLVAASTTAADGDSEGTPMALVELAATGVIVITTRHADIPEIVSDETTGFLAEPGQRDGLIDAIERSIGQVARWPSIGAAARAHIGAEFDAATQGERLAALYQRIAR